MGVPPVIIHFCLGFSLITHPFKGYPHLWKTPVVTPYINPSGSLRSWPGPGPGLVDSEPISDCEGRTILFPAGLRTHSTWPLKWPKHMGGSWKWGLSKMDDWMIWGYQHFRKHPYPTMAFFLNNTTL